MNCREVIEFLMEYMDGELAPHVRSEFERHLGCCRDCVDFLQTYRATIHLGHSSCKMCDDENPPEIPEELVRAILKARKAGEPGNC